LRTSASTDASFSSALCKRARINTAKYAGVKPALQGQYHAVAHAPPLLIRGGEQLTCSFPSRTDSC
jgi:hypothetical protein